VVQAFLTPRRVRKEYRTFRVAIVRADGMAERSVSWGEAVRIALRIVLPQGLCLIGSVAIADFLGPEVGRAILLLMMLGYFPVVGPYSMSFAVPAFYRGFRLEAYGYRFV